MRRALATISFLFLLGIIGVLSVMRIGVVNASYPVHHEYGYRTDEAVPLDKTGLSDEASNGITVTAKTLTSCDYDQMKKIQPGYTNAMMENRQAEDLRVFFIDVVFTNTSDQPATFSPNLDLEADYWTNGLALDICRGLEGNKDMDTNLAPGGSEEVTLAYLSYDAQFVSGEEWRKVDSRDYSLVLATYPDRYFIDLGTPRKYAN